MISVPCMQESVALPRMPDGEVADHTRGLAVQVQLRLEAGVPNPAGALRSRTREGAKHGVDTQVGERGVEQTQANVRPSSA